MNEEAKKVLEELKKGITTEVLNEIKTNAPLRKDIFGGDNTKSEIKEKKEKAAEYLRAKYIGDVAKAKALGMGTGTGEELVPEYFSSEIVRLAPQYGVVRRYARVYPMQGQTHKLPTAGSVVAYRVGHGAKITPSQPATGRVTLTAEKVAALVPVENELLEDANVDVIDLVTRLSAEALAKKEDIWGLLGEASGEGIFQNPDVPVVTMNAGDTTYSKIHPDYLLDMLNAIDENALTNARFIMSFSVFNALRKVKSTTTGQYVVQPPTGGQPATIWNVPVIFSQVMPKTTDADQAGKKFVILANMDYMLFGDRKSYTIDIAKEATITEAGPTLRNLFEEDMSAVRVIERVGIALGESSKAYSVLKTAAV